VGGLTSVGMGSVFYFNTGSLIYSVGYFIKRKFTPGSPINYGPPVWVCFNAFMQLLIIWCVTLTFSTSQMAGLNPGIACTIWNLTPFISGLGDRVIYKQGIKTSAIIGMVLLLICGVLVSLSSLFKTADPVGEAFKPTLSLWVPVVCSFAMPLCCAIMQHSAKYSMTRCGSNPSDFCNAFWVVFSVVLQVGCIIKYSAHIPSTAVMDWNLWAIGALGSLINCWGGFFATSAIGTGKPAGPMAALFSS
jgi:hypothetical protein